MKWDKNAIKWDACGRMFVTESPEGREHTVHNLIGEYAHKMDAKGRTSLPANFRKDIPADAQLVIAPSPTEDYLFVYLKEDYIAWIDSMFDGIGGYDVNDVDHVLLRSEMMGEGRDAEIDAAGRIMVAAEQRAIAGLEKDVVLVGNGNRIEIWDAQRREAARAKARSKKSLLLRRAAE